MFWCGHLLLELLVRNNMVTLKLSDYSMLLLSKDFNSEIMLPKC